MNPAAVEPSDVAICRVDCHALVPTALTSAISIAARLLVLPERARIDHVGEVAFDRDSSPCVGLYSPDELNGSESGRCPDWVTRRGRAT
jgi:hypothetical protein